MDFTLTREQLELQERARKAGLEFRDQAMKWDEEDTCDLDGLTRRMGEHGLLGLTMPKEYGGQDRHVMDYVIAGEAIVRASLSGVPVEPMFRTSGAGPTMLMMAEQEAVRAKYMRSVVSGEYGCALNLTEPNHGSDITHLETTATRDGDGFILNGAKKFITGAPDDHLYATFVRFDGIPGAKGIGAVMVEKGTPGCRIEAKTTYVGSRGPKHGELYFENCRVPAENLITGVGSFSRVMLGFNMERVHNGAFALGLAQAALDLTIEYTQERHQFGRPIVEFQSVYHAIADMHVRVEAARHLVYKAAATAVDGKYPEPLTATAAKYFVNDVLFQCASTAVELHGGNGVTNDYHVHRMMRDAMVSRIAGGAPNVARNVIAGQLLPHLRFPQTRS